VVNVAGRYLEFQGLELTGGGGHGFRLGSTADFLTIENCRIHDIADVGIAAQTAGAEYQGLRILGNEIWDTGLSGVGEALYLGCNEDRCRVSGSEITGNYIHDLAVPGVAEGIDLKAGSFDNLVRDNVFHDTGSSCISVGSTLGNGAANVIEGNLAFGCGDAGILAVEDVLIRNNIVLGATNSAVHVRANQEGVPDAVEVVHNTLINDGAVGVRIRDVSGGSVLVANNAIFTPGSNAIDQLGAGAVTFFGNVGVGSQSGTPGGFDDSGNLSADFVDASYSGTTPNDVFPAVGSALVGAADASHALDNDFNALVRFAPHDVGAYQFDVGGNPGWVIEAGFKPVPEPSHAGQSMAGLITLAWLARSWRTRS
jgi:hypothetical protein